jgi:FAD/FMN-containing dehydrogenase
METIDGSLDGATAAREALCRIGAGRLRTFADGLRGDVVTPDDDGYESARRVWNGMANRYPAAVATCRDAGDVAAGIAFARETDLPLAVRGGGHSVAGLSTCDAGLVLDLSPMDAVRVDPEARTARVGAGATWADLDRATQRFGLATPGGVVSHTGVAGLVLGGGTGYLSREHGLACDNLRSADVVTADGDQVVAAADRNPDLFWALRGGGGNVGVVTSFEFDLHPVGPEVAALDVWYPGDVAEAVLRRYREWATDAPTAITASPYFGVVPPDDAFPAATHGDLALGIVGAHAGDPGPGLDALAPLRTLADPLVDHSRTTRYLDLQSMYDGDFPHGRQYYWLSTYVDGLPDDVIDRLRERAAAAPSPLSSVVVWPMGGAVNVPDTDATAFAYRDAAYVLNFEACWDDPLAARENVEWARDAVESLRETAGAEGVNTNFAGFDVGSADAARAAYGPNLERLRQVKAEWDPENVFSLNQNVRPADAA